MARRVSKESIGANLPLIGMVLALLLLVGFFAFTQLRGAGEVTKDDVGADLLQARPSMSEEDGRFVEEGRSLGVDFTAASINNDIETAHTVCWALQSGGLKVSEVAVREDGTPLGKDGEDLRQRRLISAGIAAYCPSFDDQRSQLGL